MLGERPYTGKNRQQIKENILRKQKKIDIREMPADWTEQCADFINRLIVKDPSQRLGSSDGIAELKRHKWMQSIDWKKLERKQIEPPFIPNV